MVRKLPGESAHLNGVPVRMECVRWLTASGSCCKVVSYGIWNIYTWWNEYMRRELDDYIIEKACVDHRALIKPWNGLHTSAQGCWSLPEPQAELWAPREPLTHLTRYSPMVHPTCFSFHVSTSKSERLEKEEWQREGADNDNMLIIIASMRFLCAKH